MRRVLMPAAALLALALFAAGVYAADPSKKVTDFLGADAVEILKAPEKVECFRIDGKSWISPEQQAKIEEATKRVRGYAIIAQGKDQDAAFGGKIAAVLLDEKTYDFESAKACKFDPGVAFRVWKGKACADVVVCFHCAELDVVTGDKEPHRAHEDFDNARAALVALAKAAFPGDEKIQALK